MPSTADLILEALTSRRMPLRLSPEMELDTALATSEAMRPLWADMDSETAFGALTANAKAAARDAFTDLAAGEGVNLTELVAGDHEAQNALKRHITRLARSAISSMRRRFTSHYGFAVLTSDAVDAIASTLDEHTVLEVGAGNGYLAARLRDAGVVMNATDLAAPQDSNYDLGDTCHTDVDIMEAREAIQVFSPSALLWSWPFPENASGEALRAFDGSTLVYIGEQTDGCTGGRIFHQLLDSRYSLTQQVHIPSFPGVYDSAAIYQRDR